MMRFCALLGILCIIFSSCKKSEKYYSFDIELTDNWELVSGDSIHMNTSIPGNVLSVLYQNGLIENPYIADNINTLSWIGKREWVYSTTFDAPAEISQMDSVLLSLGNVVGNAKIYLNNSLLGCLNDYYSYPKFNCKNLLRYQGNILKIVFAPFESEIDSSEKALNIKRTFDTIYYPLIYKGTAVNPRVNFPCIQSPIKLIAWSEAKIQDVFVTSALNNNNSADLTIETEISSVLQGDYDIEFFINNRYVLHQQNVKLKKGITSYKTNLVIENPKLWWCNGLGNSDFYELTIVLKHDKQIVSKKKQAFGIRSVQLVPQIDSLILTNHLKLNNVPVFIKGANYLPVNIFQVESKNDTYENLILKARECNLNTLRVWGGGIIEDDQFYDLCDRYGIMVWQDVMLEADNISENNIVRKLPDSVIKRLRNHPSVVLWYNSHEQMNTNNPVFYLKDKSNILDTDSIFSSKISKYSQGIPYYPAKRYFTKSFKNKELRIEPYWPVWYNSSPIAAFQTSKVGIASEFGVQSLPDIKTMQTFDTENALDLRSPLTGAHQFNNITWLGSNNNGTQMIGAYLQMYYNEPGSSEATWYLSQLFQSEALQNAIENFKIKKPSCMGSIFWHFNDCWPSISFSVIDFYNRNKPAFYKVKKAFETVTVIPQFKNNKIKVWVANDSLSELDCSLSLSIIDFSGKQLLTLTDSIVVGGNTVMHAYEMNIRGKILQSQLNKTLCYVRLTKNNKKIADNTLYFVEPLYLDLPDPDINMQILNNGNRYQLLFRSNNLAKNLILYTMNKESVFSDNNFDLLPGIPYSVTVEYEGNELDLQNDLQIMTLVDSF